MQAKPKEEPNTDTESEDVRFDKSMDRLAPLGPTYLYGEGDSAQTLKSLCESFEYMHAMAEMSIDAGFHHNFDVYGAGMVNIMQHLIELFRAAVKTVEVETENATEANEFLARYQSLHTLYRQLNAPNSADLKEKGHDTNVSNIASMSDKTAIIEKIKALEKSSMPQEQRGYWDTDKQPEAQNQSNE